MIVSGNSSTFQDRSDELVRSISKTMTEKQLTVSTAESITGGLIGALLVSVPGASSYFKGGVTAYSNESKENVLGVRRRTLTSRGAVSKETAIEMAYGARRLFETSISVACTGIAGPSGQTDAKPIGLVYVAIVTDSDSSVIEKRYEGEREEIRKMTAVDCLKLVLDAAQRMKQA